MYVHKGRQRTVTRGTPKPTKLQTPGGDEIYSFQQETYLPKHPELSQVESLLCPNIQDEPIQLGENIDVFAKESVATISEISKHLAEATIEIWTQRKNGDEDLQQFPIKQWSEKKEP